MAEQVTEPEIKAVIGEEPRREGEYPLIYQVGYDVQQGVRVTHITEETENLGTYGVKWFYVWADKHLVAKMNALQVATILYKEKANA
jgi:hypothetical protein